MTTTLPAGPYRTLPMPEGGNFPYYVIPFDKDGRCEGPQTRNHLITEAKPFTDIFLFSHGWNNDWTAATNRYESFIKGFQDLRQRHNVAMPPGYKPLLVGIFWPSQAMAWFDSETGPDIASSDPAVRANAATVLSDTFKEVAAALPSDKRSRFYDLAQAGTLETAQAEELAKLLAAATSADDEGARNDAPSALDLLAAASSLETPEPDYNAIGTAGATAAAPKAAFGIGDVLKTLDPRNIIKPFTVWQMKDRAGKVGAHGVGPLLQQLLEVSNARIHLLGHSYGCKVVMTAASLLPAPPSLRKVESALLLQAAVSQYAFSPLVPKRTGPGGFFPALKRMNRPVVATFSEHDRALRRMFHLAVRRSTDLGELRFAAGGTPSHYAALGGYGPQDSNAKFEHIRMPVSDYDLSGTGRILGVDGSRTISGHGDISNPSTWWLAYQLATAHKRHP